MLQAQIRGFGVYTNAEVFNDILDEHFDDYQKISEEGHLQMVRCIGCAAVVFVVPIDIQLISMACKPARCTEFQL